MGKCRPGHADIGNAAAHTCRAAVAGYDSRIGMTGIYDMRNGVLQQESFHILFGQAAGPHRQRRP